MFKLWISHTFFTRGDFHVCKSSPVDQKSVDFIGVCFVDSAHGSDDAAKRDVYNRHS